MRGWQVFTADKPGWIWTSIQNICQQAYEPLNVCLLYSALLLEAMCYYSNKHWSSCSICQVCCTSEMPHVFPVFRNFPKSYHSKQIPQLLPLQKSSRIFCCAFTVIIRFSSSSIQSCSLCNLDLWNTKRKEQITRHSVFFSYYSTKASQATEREIPAQIKEIQIFFSY